MAYPCSSSVQLLEETCCLTSATFPAKQQHASTYPCNLRYFKKITPNKAPLEFEHKSFEAA